MAVVVLSLVAEQCGEGVAIESSLPEEISSYMAMARADRKCGLWYEGSMEAGSIQSLRAVSHIARAKVQDHAEIGRH